MALLAVAHEAELIVHALRDLDLTHCAISNYSVLKQVIPVQADGRDGDGSVID
jgi:hypothetical protein